MSLTTRVLIGLLTGLALGIALAETAFPGGALLVAILDPVGTLFVNAIRMTVIPLVVACLVVGVSSAPDPRAVGRIGVRAVMLFVIVLAISVSVGILVGGPLLALFPLDPAATEALRASAAGTGAPAGAGASPDFAQWLLSLVPANPVRSAADGAMLPLIIFTVVFAAALMRVDDARRIPVVRFFEGLMDASLVLVRAILTFAPYGVFALSVSIAAKMGLSALGALASYIAIVAGLLTLYAALVLYPAAAVFGRVKLRDFARAALPAQGIALSARSSLAALPAMLETARDNLHLPPAVANFFLPLAASVFRAGGGVGLTVGVLFLARLYGVELGAPELLTVGVTALVTSFSVPGIPGGSIIAMVPVLLSVGIPVEGIGILLGVDTIPDMFRTATNVTGHLSAATILARGERTEG